MDTSRQGRLLLIEDEARLRSLIARFLRIEGFAVSEAEDGRRGVEVYGDAGPFDLVIVDLDLPELPGVEVCRRIKARRPTQSILVCSAAILGPHFAAFDELGIDRTLTKPYHPAHLLDEIRLAMTGLVSPSLSSSDGFPRRPSTARPTGAASQCLVKTADSK